MQVSFDFETRSRADLKKVGMYKYAEDPSTEVLCYAYAIDDQDPVVCGPGPIDPVLLTAVLAGAQIHAWNAEFELTIWNEVCGPRYGWPPLGITQCRDTMARSAAQNLPQSLDECVKALGLPAEMQKDKRGKYLIQTLCKPKPTGKLAGTFREDPDLMAEMWSYNKQDVVAERAAGKLLRALTPEEQAVWEMTVRINRRGLPIAVDEIENICHLIDQEKERLNARLMKDTGIPAATRRDEMLAWLREHGLDLPDLTGDTVEQALEMDGLDKDVREVLLIRSRVAQTSTAKYPKMISIACNDHRIRGLLSYHGASTGRYASRGGLNAQNLARPVFKGDRLEDAIEMLTSEGWELTSWYWGDLLMDAAVSTLRSVIKAPPGYEFIDADFSSVENRVSAWISGQDDKLAAFAAGMDEYKLFAMDMYGVPYEEVTKDMRQVAKSAVLGGMFGQGWKGLIEYALTYGVTLDEERSRFLIDTYRAQYPKVQQMWWDCGDALINAVKAPGAVIEVNKVSITCRNDYLWMKLPSNRVIAWYQPRVGMQDTPWGSKRLGVTVMGVNQVTRKFERQKLIGSSAFQSAVQGTARDLLVHGMANVERAGYPPVLSVHDEVLALVPEGFGSEEEFGNLLCTPPAWASDLPLAYEAWRGIRFRK